MEPRIPPPTTRIEYIDALRGFTMILVVIQHVAYFCMNLSGVSSFHPYLRIFRMPLFFFISGFVLYKAGIVWNLKYIGGFLKRKFVVQILSTAIFFSIDVYIHNGNFIPNLTDSAKGGYWFTYTLFFYFIFYSIIRFIFRKYEDYIILILAAFFYIINWPPLYNSIPFSDCIKGTLGIEQWFYFCFFLIGTLIKKHFDFVQHVLDKDLTIVLLLLLFFPLIIFKDALPEGGIIGIITSFCTRMSGVMIAFAFFRENQSLFIKKKLIGYSLQYIGRRTLDIYLLHYLFLPTNLQSLVPFFKEHPIPVLEFIFSLIISLVVITFCLTISDIIRLSPFLSHILFGAKKK